MACLISENSLIHIVQFSANDLYGNVNNVSLQCQSSDLYVDSVMWVYNNSGEANNGDVCYRVSPNTSNLKRRCEKRGCSGVYVRGAIGCGGSEHAFNYGLYVCYICKGTKVLKTTNVAPSHGKATTTKLSEPTIYVSLTAASSIVELSTRIKLVEITEPTTISAAASSTAESSRTTLYRETTESATTTKLTSKSSTHIFSATSEPKWSIEGGTTPKHRMLIRTVLSIVNSVVLIEIQVIWNTY